MTKQELLKVQIDKILQEMFEGITIDYDKKKDRFTGVIVLPQEVKDRACSALLSLPSVEGATECPDCYERGKGVTIPCENHGGKVAQNEDDRTFFHKEVKMWREKLARAEAALTKIKQSQCGWCSKHYIATNYFEKGSKGYLMK
jgi:hypothetical protein